MNMVCDVLGTGDPDPIGQTGVHLPTDDGGAVIDLLGIRDRQYPAAPSLQPDRLIVGAPVQDVLVSGFVQEVRRQISLGKPSAQLSQPEGGVPTADPMVSLTPLMSALS
jgi:hypothetical protein